MGQNQKPNPFGCFDDFVAIDVFLGTKGVFECIRI